MSEQKHTTEPFGYFKAEPFGWTDCEETDDCAVPLYDHESITSIAKQRDQLQAKIDAINQNIAIAATCNHIARMEQAEQQRDELAAAIAACKLKDEALQNCEGMLDELRDYPITHDEIIEALAIQPDDSALKAWLGEPITKVIHYDEVGMPHTIYLNKPLYSPKGLK